MRGAGDDLTTLKRVVDFAWKKGIYCLMGLLSAISTSRLDVEHEYFPRGEKNVTVCQVERSFVFKCIDFNSMQVVHNLI